MADTDGAFHRREHPPEPGSADADASAGRRCALLANYPVAGLETVAQFAKRAGVSGPTILRLVAKLGFRQLPRFPAGAARRTRAPPAATARQGSGGARPRTAARFPASYGRAIIANIERSLAEVPRAAFEAAVDLLADPPPAHPAHGRPLHRQPRPAVLSASARTPAPGPAGERPDRHLGRASARSRPPGCAGRLRHPALSRRMWCASPARRRGLGAGVILLFTDHWLSPIAAVARHVFALRTAMPSSWESFAALSALTEASWRACMSNSWRRQRSGAWSGSRPCAAGMNPDEGATRKQ